MRKKFKTKKKFNIKILLIPTIIILVLITTIYLNKNIRSYITNEIIIKNIINSNNYAYQKQNNLTIPEKLYNYIKENIFNTPTNLLENQLNYNKKNSEVISFVYKEISQPLVYIYNSHQKETYSMKYLEDYNIVPDVLMASNMLKDKLSNLKINSIVEETDITDYMKKNNLNHAGSYKASRYFLTQAINNYPSIKLFIDLHRDSINHKNSTTIINDKPYAKVLFVIGLENENYENNLSVVNKLNNIILKKYPSLTRGIMKKQGYNVNGIYNQDLNSNVILIEIGAFENNIEEVNNTLDLIAQAIGEYLNEEI